MLFIVIHQVYELWFKLLLHEIEKVKRDFRGQRPLRRDRHLQALRTIMKTLVEQVDILETMTPMSFVSFRDRLDTASGFQSVQFRELEFVLGYKRAEVTRRHPPDTDGQRALARPAARRALGGRRILRLPRAARRRRSPTSCDQARRRRCRPQPNEALQEELLRLYQEQPDLEILFELMTDFDEGFQEWRYRHIKLVERTIGTKKGTGGSLGVEFLKQSLFQPLFPDLWADPAPDVEGMHAIDISPVRLAASLAVWPGDTPALPGGPARSSRGATPSPFRPCAPRSISAPTPTRPATMATALPISQPRPLELYLGPCEVMRVAPRAATRGHAGRAAASGRAPRVLLATGTFPDPQTSIRTSPRSSPELVDRLHAAGVSLVGHRHAERGPVRTRRSCRRTARSWPTTWRSSKGSCSDEVPEGLYELIALPLRLEDSMPVRCGPCSDRRDHLELDGDGRGQPAHLDRRAVGLVRRRPRA